MPDAVRILAGAMSGTSADGVDVALVEVSGRGLGMTARLLHHQAHPYDGPLKQRIFAARGDGRIALAELAMLGRDISLAYAAAINEALRAANLAAADLTAVAAHGQTLFHDPPNTIQWLDPALVAAEVGCAVVSDFRRADCAAGGQGAPLVPFADYILFRDPTKNRLVVNIGGIANVTVLPAACRFDQVLAYDTGPGNCVSDHLMRQADPSGPGYDEGGQLALQGKPIRALCEAFRDDPYFILHLSPFRPKSTDVPRMIELFETARTTWAPNDPLPDLLASACYCCVLEVMWAMRYFGMQPDCEVIVSGGGAENACMMAMMESLMGKPRRTEAFGVLSPAKEALAFALLGAATIDNEPSNVPSVTGARRPVVLGSITPKPC